MVIVVWSFPWTTILIIISPSDCILIAKYRNTPLCKGSACKNLVVWIKHFCTLTQSNERQRSSWMKTGLHAPTLHPLPGSSSSCVFLRFVMLHRSFIPLSCREKLFFSMSFHFHSFITYIWIFAVGGEEHCSSKFIASLFPTFLCSHESHYQDMLLKDPVHHHW